MGLELPKMDGEKSIVVWLIATLVTVLMAGNIFFVRRLVDEIDETKTMVVTLHEQVSIINAQLHTMSRDASCKPYFGPESEEASFKRGEYGPRASNGHG